MEWVETTARTVEEAKDAALDELGVAPEEAEFEIIETPRPGLFGRLRGEARVRTRVRPAEVRPKNERRKKSDRSNRGRPRSKGEATTDAATSSSQASGTNGGARREAPVRAATNERTASTFSPGDSSPESEATPNEVGAAAVDFVEGLVKAFGLNGTVALHTDGVELDVSVDGDELGLLIGPGGQTLLAVQNLARVAAQRRLGDHDTRLRVDVAGYREKRKTALEAFVRKVAAEVKETGVARSLEPMTSADRKIVHDVLNETEGIVSRSEGDDPQRRVVVAPAS